MMVLTIIVPVLSENDPKNLIPIVNSIEKGGYSLGKIEIVYLVISDKDYGVKSFDGKPIIKVRYYKDYITGLNDCVKKSLGDLIVFANLDSRFEPHKLTSMVQCFEQRKLGGLFLGEGFMVIRKTGKTQLFPEDLFDLKTYLIMDALCCHSEILGEWGALHKTEIKRFSYKLPKLEFQDQWKIIKSCLKN